MHLQFCGAAGEVTGSCTRLNIASSTFLIDCGLFQGAKYSEDRNYDPFPFNADEIDAVFVTHAHLDHVGRLPKLVNQGFHGKIYSTDATRDLALLILLDSAGLMTDEAERNNHPPLYTEEDVLHTMERFVTLPYDTEIRVAPGVTAVLRNSGHILGSSYVQINGDSKTIIFSGDMGNHPVPLLEKAENLPPAEAIVVESTYGDRTHGDFGEGVAILEQAIRDTARDKGVLLIPAFSMERTQELLTVINDALAKHRIPELSAYLDGPLGIKISRVYEKYDHYFNDAIQAQEKTERDHSVLTFPHLTVTETSQQSRMINDVDPPKMIIAGSGMMQGGRILHHLKRYLPFENTRVVVVGHQVEHSLGRRLLEGARTITIHGEHIEVNAKIIGTHSFSSHMDKNQLLEWLKTMPHLPKTVFLNHGDDTARAALSELLSKELGVKVVTPKYQEGFTLDATATPTA